MASKKHYENQKQTVSRYLRGDSKKDFVCTYPKVIEKLQIDFPGVSFRMRYVVRASTKLFTYAIVVSQEEGKEGGD